jgi:hypothetical protein
LWGCDNMVLRYCGLAVLQSKEKRSRLEA